MKPFPTIGNFRGKTLIFFILITSGMDFMLFGYDQGLFGGILGGDLFQDMLGHPSPTMSGLVTAIYDIGCAFGAVVAFVYGERIGRKNSILLANIIVIVGAAIQTASYDYWQMFVARIVRILNWRLSDVLLTLDRLRELVWVLAQSLCRFFSRKLFPQKIEVHYSSFSQRSSSLVSLLRPGSALPHCTPTIPCSGASQWHASACFPRSW